MSDDRGEECLRAVSRLVVRNFLLDKPKVMSEMSYSEQNYANQDQISSECDEYSSDSESDVPNFDKLYRPFTVKKPKENAKISTSLSKIYLHRAVLRGDTDSVRLLSLKLSPNTRDNAGDTPLLLAIRSGNMEMVQLLIKAGADVNYVNHKSSTKCTLHDAIDAGYDMTKLLLDHGANPNQTNHHGRTALYKAANVDHSKSSILRLLIERGADMYNGDKGRKSPFKKLISYHRVDGIEIFFNCGFDITRYESSLSLHDSKPLHRAVKIRRPKKWDSSSSQTLLSSLIDHYKSKGLLNLECVDRKGHTVLESAVIGDNSFYRTNIRLLIEAGAQLGNALKRLLSSQLWMGMGVCGLRKDDDESEDLEGSDGSNMNFKEYLLAESKSRIWWKKAQCVVTYRVLFESINAVEDPVYEEIKISKDLLKHYESCKSEIALSQKTPFHFSITYHTILTQEDFWRRMRTADAFKSFDLDELKKKFPIYSDDLRTRFLKAKAMYDLWHSATRVLKRLLGTNMNLCSVFSCILSRLSPEDLCSLSILDVL